MHKSCILPFMLLLLLWILPQGYVKALQHARLPPFALNATFAENQNIKGNHLQIMNLFREGSSFCTLFCFFKTRKMK